VLQFVTINMLTITLMHAH